MCKKSQKLRQWGHLGPWDLHLNKLGKVPTGQATKLQASEPSGSEEEIFYVYFYGSNLGPLWPGPFRNLRPSFERT